MSSFIRLLLAVAISAAATTTAIATVTVTGDKSAWADVGKAYQALNRLSGYRMKATMPVGEMVMEFVPAKKAMRMTMQTPQGAMETVAIAGQVRYRMNFPGAPSGWRCQGAPAPVPPRDPTEGNGSVNVTRGRDATIDGAAMHTYTYTMSGDAGAGTGKTTLYVNAQSGLPRRTVMAAPQGSQTFDYYDYGTDIQIELPACS